MSRTLLSIPSFWANCDSGFYPPKGRERTALERWFDTGGHLYRLPGDADTGLK
ncbi:MAG: hypothetical protein ABSH50_04190 [Bryobacteraceae bacterium]